VPARASGECWESYFCVRCRAGDWEESQTQVAGAFSQAPHLLREHRATSMRVVDGSSTVTHVHRGEDRCHDPDHALAAIGTPDKVKAGPNELPNSASRSLLPVLS